MTARLEGLQALALKTIYGFDHSYAWLLEDTGLETLQQRRLRLIDKFLEKTLANERFSERWFPTKEFLHIDLRRELYYEEKFARTDRLYNSPLFFFRRRLNERFLTATNKRRNEEQNATQSRD